LRSFRQGRREGVRTQQRPGESVRQCIGANAASILTHPTSLRWPALSFAAQERGWEIIKKHSSKLLNILTF